MSMNRLYDDHQVTDSSTQGQMHAMAQTDGPASVQNSTGQMDSPGGQQGQPGGLNATSETDDVNPIRAAVAASNYSHDDIMVVLQVLTLIAWVAMLYMMKKQD